MTTASVEEFICTACDETFGTQEALSRHQDTHSVYPGKAPSKMPGPKTVAAAIGIAAAVAVAALIAWRLAKRRHETNL